MTNISKASTRRGRGPWHGTWWTTVHTETSDFEPITVDVLYQSCPAEPDVGISQGYIEVLQCEVDGTSVWFDEDTMERIQREIEEEADYGPDEY